MDSRASAAFVEVVGLYSWALTIVSYPALRGSSCLGSCCLAAAFVQAGDRPEPGGHEKYPPQGLHVCSLEVQDNPSLWFPVPYLITLTGQFLFAYV